MPEIKKYLNKDGLEHYNDAISDVVSNSYVRSFDTVAAMQAATDLKSGMVTHTNGFHASGDGGAAYYVISASGTANGMDVFALQGGLYATIVAPSVATPEMFGAYGDGTHDDRDAIQKCVDLAPCSLLANDYLVTIRGTSQADWGVINIPSNRDVEINGTVTMEANASNGYHMFNVENVSNVKIHGIGSIIGDKDTHTGNTGEWGHCIRIGASTDVEIYGLTLTKGWGDGVSIGSQIMGVEKRQPKRIYMHDCNVIDNSRNNISLVSVSDSVFSNLYIAVADRTSPMAGIDFEPNPNTVSEVVNNVVIDNCVFENNSYADILVVHNSGNNLESNVRISNVFCTNQIAAILSDDNTHLKIDNASFRTGKEALVIACGSKSDVKVTNSEVYYSGTRAPIYFNNPSNNIDVELDIYDNFPTMFVGRAVSTVNGSKTNRLKFRTHVAQTFAETSSANIMQNTPLYEMNVEFCDVHEVTTNVNVPSYGCDMKLTAALTYVNTYYLLARKGCKFKIENASGSTTTVRNVSGTPVIGTIADGHVGLFESFADGTITKIAEYEAPQA